MCKVVQKLRETVPPMNFDIRYIAEAAKEQPEELREKFAAAWAARWLIHLQDREKAAHDQQLVIAAEDMIETDLVEGFQSMVGIQSESSDLDRELSCLADPALRHNQLFTSLMKDVDRNMMILPPDTKAKPWMDPVKAAGLLDGTLMDLRHVTEFMANMDTFAQKPAT